MTDPDVLKARPFWEYFAVMDASTRPAHAAMNGRVYPADQPGLAAMVSTQRIQLPVHGPEL